MRAESDFAIKKVHDIVGFSAWCHVWMPVAIEHMKREVDPIDHSVFGAASWGRIPKKSAY